MGTSRETLVPRGPTSASSGSTFAFQRLGLLTETLPEPTRTFVRPEWERLVVELEVPTTTHMRRAVLGNRLAQIGDRRAGVGLTADGTPDIVWCPIPKGSVSVEERGTRSVSAFWLSKSLVTVLLFSQYRAFCEDPDGYRGNTHWLLGRPSMPSEQWRRTGNHPADNVSWSEATAFCRWLSARLRLNIRLPTEFEWVRAAGGEHSESLYPWGSAWQDGYANTSESRLGRTTAVGMYPQGASADGILNLSGNVWEWCADVFDRTAALDRDCTSHCPGRSVEWESDKRVLFLPKLVFAIGKKRGRGLRGGSRLAPAASGGQGRRV